MFNVNKKKYIKYLFGIVLTTIFVLVTTSYYFIVNYTSNRIYNPRKVPKEYRVELIKDYINRVYKENSILFIGDSQPNGHKYPTDKIFTTLLQNKIEKNVLNFATQDAGILDNIYILNYLKDNHMIFDTVVFNANPLHVKRSDSQRLEVKNPQDYKWAIIKEIKSFLNLALEPNPVNMPNEKIYLKKYENYFDMNTSTLSDYNSKLQNLITVSKSISKNVIVYITPHSKNAVLYNNKDDLKVLENFSKEMFKVCNSENIICFEPSIKDDKYYIDIVHFNSLGHQEMSNKLSKLLLEMKE